MNQVRIIMYHYVRDLAGSRYPQIKGLDVNLFKNQVLFLKENFNIVTMEQVIEASYGGKVLPENAVLLTFDDGYIDNYAYVFPILDELHVQGSFFVPGKTIKEHQLLDVNKIHYILASADINKLLSDLLVRMDYYRGIEFDYPSNDKLVDQYAKAGRYDGKEIMFVKYMLQTVLPEPLRKIISSELFKENVGISEGHLAKELYLTVDQIKTMKRNGMYFGIHSYDHYWLGRLSYEKVEQEIVKSLDVMGDYIDRNKWVMNYPYGSYNDDVIQIAKEKGACLGITTEVRQADLSKDDRFKLPRYDCNDFPPVSSNFLNC